MPEIPIGGITAGTTFSETRIVQSASDLSGTLDSTVLYFIDGVIDMGTQSIEVPVGGFNYTGWTFDVSKLTSSEDNFTLFTSPAGGSGNVVGSEVGIEITGTNSKVYDLTGNTGNETIELDSINYNNCTSLGEVTSYRQGFESGTGRFGGTPTLTLSGTWAGGYRITTSIVRSLDNAMNAPLFKAGTGLEFNSRFLTDINADLGTTASLFDFAPSNFAAPSLCQLMGVIITRNGNKDPEDTTITPNISESDLECFWKDNQGVPNTYVGGTLTITAETATTISAQNTYYDIAGTWTSSGLQHFDEPSNGQLRNLGGNPRDFLLISDLIIEGTQNNQIDIRVLKYDSSTSSDVQIFHQRRQINNLVGSRDVAFFLITVGFTLDQNDYIRLQVENTSGTANVTAVVETFFSVIER